MPTSYGSDSINGQLVGMRTTDAYNPRPWGPVMLAAPSTVNTVPPMMAQGGLPLAASRQAGVTPGDPVATAGVSRPFDWAMSPLPVIVFCLVVAVLWLRGVHWGG